MHQQTPPDHRQLIEEFILLTGASSQEANQLLQASCGNLNLATELYFDSKADCLNQQLGRSDESGKAHFQQNHHLHHQRQLLQLQEAIQIAIQTERKLVIFFMEPASESCKAFLNQVWLNFQVGDSLQAHGFLMHRIDMTTEEPNAQDVQAFFGFSHSLRQIPRVSIVHPMEFAEIDSIPLIMDTNEFIERVLGFVAAAAAEQQPSEPSLEAVTYPNPKKIIIKVKFHSTTPRF
jgi:thioredoxin-related protein